MTPSQTQITSSAQPGHWIEVRGVHGQPPRRGEIIEVLGTDQHRRYVVRWDEQHQSIVYPADGVIVTQAPQDAAPANG